MERSPRATLSSAWQSEDGFGKLGGHRQEWLIAVHLSGKIPTLTVLWPCGSVCRLFWRPLPLICHPSSQQAAKYANIPTRGDRDRWMNPKDKQLMWVSIQWVLCAVSCTDNYGRKWRWENLNCISWASLLWQCQSEVRCCMWQQEPEYKNSSLSVLHAMTELNSVTDSLTIPTEETTFC